VQKHQIALASTLAYQFSFRCCTLPVGINSNIESLIEASGNKLVQFCSTLNVRVPLVASYNSSVTLR